MRFVADLTSLAADRAMEESRIESRRETGLKVAQRNLQESQEKLATWFKRELSDAATEKADRRQAASARFQVESAACERQFVHVQEQAAEEFDAGMRLAKRTLEETGWEAEAYFDGNKQIAPKQLEEFDDPGRCLANQGRRRTRKGPKAAPPLETTAAGGRRRSRRFRRGRRRLCRSTSRARGGDHGRTRPTRPR